MHLVFVKEYIQMLMVKPFGQVFVNMVHRHGRKRIFYFKVQETVLVFLSQSLIGEAEVTIVTNYNMV